jgi:hypothetical protein
LEITCKNFGSVPKTRMMKLIIKSLLKTFQRNRSSRAVVLSDVRCKNNSIKQPWHNLTKCVALRAGEDLNLATILSLIKNKVLS